jgi:Mn2+/Fe2+ NRAMP family transporter
MPNTQRIMGEKTNTLWLNILGWSTTVVLFVASAGLIWSFVR